MPTSIDIGIIIIQFFQQAAAVHIMETKSDFTSESEYTRSLDLVLIVLRILNRFVAPEKLDLNFTFGLALSPQS